MQSLFPRETDISSSSYRSFRINSVRISKVRLYKYNVVMYVLMSVSAEDLENGVSKMLPNHLMTSLTRCDNSFKCEHIIDVI